MLFHALRHTKIKKKGCSLEIMTSLIMTSTHTVVLKYSHPPLHIKYDPQYIFLTFARIYTTDSQPTWYTITLSLFVVHFPFYVIWNMMLSHDNGLKIYGFKLVSKKHTKVKYYSPCFIFVTLYFHVLSFSLEHWWERTSWARALEYTTRGKIYLKVKMWR